jgi:predicted phosphodiesterase
MRVAAIADIHGNLPALEAVLADIANTGADMIVDLGDCCSGPLWPKETEELLKACGMPTVRGNHDRILAEMPRALMGLTDAYAFDCLTEAQRERLGALPTTLAVVPGVLAFHATPANDNQYLLESIVGDRMVLASSEDVRTRLDGARAPLILCAHSHQPRVVFTPDGNMIVNPGSVGCPAYIDTDHASQTGSPHARYAIATETKAGWRADLRAVVYDWERASQQARRVGRPEWAHWLATGYAE